MPKAGLSAIRSGYPRASSILALNASRCGVPITSLGNLFHYICLQLIYFIDCWSGYYKKIGCGVYSGAVWVLSNAPQPQGKGKCFSFGSSELGRLRKPLEGKGREMAAGEVGIGDADGRKVHQEKLCWEGLCCSQEADSEVIIRHFTGYVEAWFSLRDEWRLARKWGSVKGCVLFTVWGSKFYLVILQVYILPANLFFITLICSFDLILFNNFQQVHLQAARSQLRVVSAVKSC